MTIQQVADAYYIIVKSGRRTIDQIPTEHRAAVIAKLEQDAMAIQESGSV